MKTCLVYLLLFLLMLLSACTDSTAPIKDTTSAKTQTTTSVPLISDTEKTSASVSAETELTAVRYRLSYDITDIHAAYPEYLLNTGMIYSRGGLVYICGPRSADDFCVYVFDQTGTMTDIISVPPIRSEVTATPFYAFPWKDDLFLVGYTTTDNGNWSYMLAFIDGTGKILRSTFLPSLSQPSSVLVMERTSVYGDYSTAISVDCNDGMAHLYDEELNEYCHPNYLGKPMLLDNSWIRFGFNAYNRQLIHMKTGEIKSSPMRLPSTYDMASVIVGDDGNQYFRNDNGIYQYRGNDQPVLILEHLGAGFPKPGSLHQDIIILNEQTVLFRNSNTLQLYHIARIPDTDQRKILQVDFMGIETYNTTWFADAVTAFNNQNPNYRVDLNYIGADKKYNTMPEMWQAQLEEMLLYGSHPDIVIIGDSKLLTPHYDKHIFLDLNELLRVSPLGCITEAYGYGDALYQIPLTMHLDTFAAKSTVVNAPLTYTKFFSILDSLGEDDILTDTFNTTFYQNALMDFIDPEAKTANYDCEEFRNVLRYMRMLERDTGTYTDIYAGSVNCGLQLWPNGRQYGDYGKYWTVNGTVGTALEQERMKFLSVTFNSLRAFNAVKLIFGDTDFTLCGYPCTDGNGARIYTAMSATVLWDTDVPDGCAAFLNFILSDELQTKPEFLNSFLPVTSSAMAKAIDLHRYSYYDKSTVAAILDRNTPDYVSLNPKGVSETYLSSFNGIDPTEENCTVLEITSEEKQMLLDFFESAHMRANIDPFVKTIINEEVSFWEGNARSLEETTKIIQSRVWIYINE